MYRVRDTEKKCWIVKDIFMSPNGKLFKIQKSAFGWTKVPLELSQDRYIHHEDTGLYDKTDTLIYMGDYVKAQVDDDRTVIGLVAFADEIAAYVVLCLDSEEYYTLGTEVSQYIEVIGNVFDGYKDEDGNIIEQNK